PSDVLGALHQQGVTVTKIGTDTVRGSDTTHWRVDVASVPSTTIAADDCSADAAMHTLELWTDNEDRVRRIQAAGSEGGMISLKATTEFYDSGVPVDVNAPPASQVSDPSQS